MRYTNGTAPSRLKEGLFALAVMAKTAGDTAAWFRGSRAVRILSEKAGAVPTLLCLPVANSLIKNSAIFAVDARTSESKQDKNRLTPSVF